MGESFLSFLKRLYCVLIWLCVYLYGHAHSWHTCECQRGWFCLPTMWVLGVEFRSVGMEAVLFICTPIAPARNS